MTKLIDQNISLLRYFYQYLNHSLKTTKQKKIQFGESPRDKLRPCQRWIFKTLHFREFWKFSIFEAQKFFGKTYYLQICKNFAKKRSKISSDQNPLFLGHNPLFWVKKPCFWGKTGVLGSKTGVSKYYKLTKFSEFVLFWAFRKLQKKWRKNWTLKIREKLVPTWIPTRTFEFKFGMQGLT